MARGDFRAWLTSKLGGANAKADEAARKAEEKQAAAAAKAADEKTMADDARSARIEKLAGGFLSGVGALGLVVFTGAAVQWQRFDGAGIPADQAIAVVPKNELLALGAQALAFSLVLAAVLVGAAYYLDRYGIGNGPFKGLCLVLVVAAMAYGYWEDDLSIRQTLVLGLVAALTSFFALIVGRRTDARFAWLGATLFLAVLATGAAREVLVNAKSPQVRPVAIIRGPDDLGLVGVYVAVTDKRVYVGLNEEFSYLGVVGETTTVEKQSSPKSLVVVPCADVTSYVIGKEREPGSTEELNASDATPLQREANKLLDLLFDVRSRGRALEPTSQTERNQQSIKLTPPSSTAPKAEEKAPPAAKAVC